MKEFMDAYIGKGGSKSNTNANSPEMSKDKANVINIFKEYSQSLVEKGVTPKVDPIMMRKFLKYVGDQFGIIKSDSKRVSMEGMIVPLLDSVLAKIQKEASTL